jgi:hypothetical protein
LPPRVGARRAGAIAGLSDGGLASGLGLRVGAAIELTGHTTSISITTELAT